jgi:hypothetical protein
LSYLKGRQTAYGSLDHRFVGISLRFQTSEAFEDFRNSFTGPLVRSEDPNRAREQLWTASVYEHELRHFHDFLLSPFSTTLFRLRITAALNGSSYLLNGTELSRELRHPAMPIPFGKWVYYSPSRRKEQIEMWSRIAPPAPGEHWSPFPIPYFNATQTSVMTSPTGQWDEPFSSGDLDSLETLMYLTVNAYESMRSYATGFASELGVSIRATDVFELLAILLQAHVILRAIDQRAMRDFLAEVLTTARYGPTLALFLDPFIKSGIFAGNVGHAALTWAIVGRPFGWTDDKRPMRLACPGYRLAFLLKRFASDGIPSDETPCQDLFDTWDSAIGYIPVREGLESVIRANADALNKYRKMKNQIASLSTEIVPVFERFVKAQADLIERFLQDPDSYVHVDRYYDSVDGLPKPPVRIVLDGFGIRHAAGENLGFGRVVGSFPDPSEPAYILAHEFLLDPDDKHFDADACYQLAGVLAYVDYHFQNFERTDERLVEIGDLLRTSGRRKVFNLM